MTPRETILLLSVIVFGHVIVLWLSTTLWQQSKRVEGRACVCGRATETVETIAYDGRASNAYDGRVSKAISAFNKSQDECDALKAENRRLLEQNRDLQAQIPADYRNVRRTS